MENGKQEQKAAAEVREAMRRERSMTYVGQDMEGNEEKKKTKSNKSKRASTCEKEQLLLLLLPPQPDGTTRVCTGVGRVSTFAPALRGFTWCKNCHCKKKITNFFLKKNCCDTRRVQGVLFLFSTHETKGACELPFSWVFVFVCGGGVWRWGGYVASHSLLVMDTYDLVS